MITPTQSTRIRSAGLRSLTHRTPPRALSATINSGLMAKAARFRKDRRGATAILFALSMPMLIGGLGLGFEVSNWYMTQRGMQNAADAAVLAAASNASSNYDIEGKAVAAQYGFTNGVNNAGVTVSQNVACPGGGNTCYSATISSSVPLYLSPVLGYAGSGGGRQNLAATAIAKRGTIPRPYCVLALASSGASDGILTNGAPKANLAGCSVKSNTNATCHGHNLGADFGEAVGTDNGCGQVQNSGLPATVDPYSGLAPNIPANTCGGSYPQEPSGTTWSSPQSLSGNVKICGDLKLTGNVTVNAPSGAVLVIYNGRLDANGYKIQTSSGSGLTVVFSGTAGGSYIHAPTGGGTLDITAPTSGPWSGVAIYQDPTLTSGVNISAAGNSPTWDITGLVYLPHSSVTFNGAVNKSSNGKSCFAMVVDNITVSGTADILPKGECVAAGLVMPTGDAAGRGLLVS
jgi:Flp pilus assembly protein TadG